MTVYNAEYNEKIREICSKYRNYQVVLRSSRFIYLLNYILDCTDEVFKTQKEKKNLEDV